MPFVELLNGGKREERGVDNVFPASENSRKKTKLPAVNMRERWQDNLRNLECVTFPFLFNSKAGSGLKNEMVIQHGCVCVDTKA